MGHIDHFPSEVISLILNHVDRKSLHACTLINKSFSSEVIPLLWRHLDINSNDVLASITTILEEASGSLMGESVRSVIIASKLLSDDDLLSFVKHVPLLNSLTLREASNITDESIVRVPLYVPHLTHLSLRSAHITQLSMEAMARHWQHQLGSLELIACNDLNYNLYASLLQYTALKELNIIQCYLDETVERTCDTIQEAAAWNVMALPHLTHLFIRQYKANYAPFLAALCTAPAWPRLTHLDLEPCYAMTDAMAIALIQSHPNLTSLSLVDGPQLTDKTLDAIVKYLPNIIEVGLCGDPGITPDGLRRLVKTCRRLEYVDCTECKIYPHHFPDVDRNFMEFDTGCGTDNYSWYVSALYGGAFDGGARGLDDNMIKAVSKTT
ncbi:hypothetical protein BCR42DRAFT_427955 [Absidia repens]|uniref:F-box domain-containing protein n=1 Tax=Absidia repens TaxID=90262 RepID=A0A1X2HZ27_9FUNG|nr:hypothetical protein BCR42DRAFT_427955 [Absidia repens]